MRHFRAASSYIAAHRGKTFVILLPGEVTARPDVLAAVSADLSLLHGLGVRLVVVLGTKPQIDARLARAGDGSKGRLVGGYRVTDDAALAAAVDAAGAVRVAVEASLSAALAVPAARRHGRASPDEEFHYDPPARVVSGNFVTAVRRGVVGGVDFGATGAVRGCRRPRCVRSWTRARSCCCPIWASPFQGSRSTWRATTSPPTRPPRWARTSWSA